MPTASGFGVATATHSMETFIDVKLGLPRTCPVAVWLRERFSAGSVVMLVTPGCSSRTALDDSAAERKDMSVVGVVPASAGTAAASVAPVAADAPTRGLV